MCFESSNFHKIKLFSTVGFVKKRGFIFEGTRRLAVINLVTLIHKYSYLVSLEIVVGYRKLRSLKGTLGQFNCVTRESRYPVSITEPLTWNL